MLFRGDRNVRDVGLLVRLGFGDDIVWTGRVDTLLRQRHLEDGYPFLLRTTAVGASANVEDQKIA